MLGCLCAKIFSETQLVDKNHKAITACFDYYIVKSLAKFRWQLGRAGVRPGQVRTLSGCARNWWEIVRARTRDWKLEGRGRRAWTCGVVAVSRGRAPQHWLFPPFPDQKPLCWRRNWIRRQVNCSLSLTVDRPLLVTTSPRAVVTIIPSLIQRLSTAPATSHQPLNLNKMTERRTVTAERGAKRSYFYNVHRIQHRELQMGIMNMMDSEVKTINI